MPRITKRVVEDAKPGPAEYFVWCDDLPGFGVRIYPSGRRGYLVQYRADGRSRRAAIGLHGRITAEEARRQAMALLGEVAKGGDPAEERATNRAAMTVAELCQRYREALAKNLIPGKRGQPKKLSTIMIDHGRIDRHIIPLIGRRRVKDLTPVDISRFVRDVQSGKTAVVEKSDKLRGKAVVTGGPATAARAAGLLGGILSYAVSEGIIPSNPAIGVPKPTSRPRQDRLSPDQFRKLGDALAKLEGEGINPKAIAAVRLLALTGCRLNEVLGLRWSEVDEAGHAFRLADSKEGASTRPIGAAAFRVLAAIDREDGSEWVLPGERRDLPYGGLKGVWEKLRADTGLAVFNRHMLRYSFASVAGDLGYAEATRDALVGHSARSMNARYTHILDAVLIAAADRVANTIWGYMAGTEKLGDGAAPDA